jgi:hypothetical protein
MIFSALVLMSWPKSVFSLQEKRNKQIAKIRNEAFFIIENFLFLIQKANSMKKTFLLRGKFCGLNKLKNEL